MATPKKSTAKKAPAKKATARREPAVPKGVQIAEPVSWDDAHEAWRQAATEVAG